MEYVVLMYAFFREGRLGNIVVTKPYAPGHEASGVIMEVGKKVTNFVNGDFVVIEPGIPCSHCTYCYKGRYNLCPKDIFLSAPPINGTFCDYINILYYNVHKIPKNLSFQKATFTEPAAVAVYAINRDGVMSGLTAVIIGAGPIGLLTLQAFKAAGGIKVTCIDILENRLNITSKLGADETLLAKNNKDLYNTADVVFETAGNVKATQSMFNRVNSDIRRQAGLCNM